MQNIYADIMINHDIEPEILERKRVKKFYV